MGVCTQNAPFPIIPLISFSVKDIATSSVNYLKMLVVCSTDCKHFNDKLAT